MSHNGGTFIVLELEVKSWSKSKYSTQSGFENNIVSRLKVLVGERLVIGHPYNAFIGLY